MAQYRISGVWKDKDLVIAYAVHQIFEGATSKAKKLTSQQTIELLEMRDNTATTWIWNYTTGRWNVGDKVVIANEGDGKYLCCSRANKLTHQLNHLINLDWVV